MVSLQVHASSPRASYEARLKYPNLPWGSVVLTGTPLLSVGWMVRLMQLLASRRRIWYFRAAQDDSCYNRVKYALVEEREHQMSKRRGTLNTHESSLSRLTMCVTYAEGRAGRFSCTSKVAASATGSCIWMYSDRRLWAWLHLLSTLR